VTLWLACSFLSLEATTGAKATDKATAAGDWVRAHVLLCMLAYYLEWHMRQALALFCSTIISAPRLPPRDPL
jgi:hypothetical protein